MARRNELIVFGCLLTVFQKMSEAREVAGVTEAAHSNTQCCCRLTHTGRISKSYFSLIMHQKDKSGDDLYSSAPWRFNLALGDASVSADENSPLTNALFILV